jgi:hypothetical protein
MPAALHNSVRPSQSGILHSAMSVNPGSPPKASGILAGHFPSSSGMLADLIKAPSAACGRGEEMRNVAAASMRQSTHISTWIGALDGDKHAGACLFLPNIQPQRPSKSTTKCSRPAYPTSREHWPAPPHQQWITTAFKNGDVPGWLSANRLGGADGIQGWRPQTQNVCVRAGKGRL